MLYSMYYVACMLSNLVVVVDRETISMLTLHLLAPDTDGFQQLCHGCHFPIEVLHLKQLLQLDVFRLHQTALMPSETLISQQ